MQARIGEKSKNVPAHSRNGSISPARSKIGPVAVVPLRARAFSRRILEKYWIVRRFRVMSRAGPHFLYRERREVFSPPPYTQGRGTGNETLRPPRSHRWKPASTPIR